MYKIIMIAVVGLLITAQSVLAAPYFTKPTPVVLMVMEMKPGCRSAHPPPACIGAMKALNRSFLYYDYNRKLKRKVITIGRR